MWDLLYVVMVIFLLIEMLKEALQVPGLNQKDYYPIN
jgi:hypothetical protein